MEPQCCPFCHLENSRFALENDAAVVFPDAFPVVEGHLLVVPRRHVASLFDLPEEELAAVWRLLAEVRGKLAAELNPYGFTIGVNDGPASFVFSVCLSPDGSRIASGWRDNTVKVWESRSGAEIATLRGHTGQVSSVCFSHDGARIASGSGDGTVKVWDSRSDPELATLPGHTSMVYSVCFSPDGTRIASGSQDGTLKVWDSRSGTEAATKYDPFAEDYQLRIVRTPLYYAEEIEAAEKHADTFAASFHRRCLAQRDNLRILAWARLAAGDSQACLQTLQQMQQQQQGLAARWQLSATLASGLQVRPLPGVVLLPAAIAPIGRQEEHRRGAVLVRAATLLSDSGIPSADLVALARSCVEDDPQNWQFRELLGAALITRRQVCRGHQGTRSGREAACARRFAVDVAVPGLGPPAPRPCPGGRRLAEEGGQGRSLGGAGHAVSAPRRTGTCETTPQAMKGQGPPKQAHSQLAALLEVVAFHHPGSPAEVEQEATSLLGALS
jgi:hypothetical protein